MACYVEMCGFGPFESAIVRVEPRGTVTAYTGTSAHGQGHETTFAQIIADHLGVDFDKIVVRHGDTSNTPMGNGTGGQPEPGRRRLGHAAGDRCKVQEQARAHRRAHARGGVRGRRGLRRRALSGEGRAGASA